MLPLLRLWSDGRLARLATCAAVVVSVGAVVFCTWGAATPQRARPDAPLRVLEDGYVGSATCRSCHPGEHASWHGSFHRTMTQVASRETVIPQFERLELDWYGEPVVLEWRGDELWTRFVRGGGRPGPVERPIEQLTGSHHMQVFWYSTGEGRELAPVEPWRPWSRAPGSGRRWQGEGRLAGQATHWPRLPSSAPPATRHQRPAAPVGRH